MVISIELSLTTAFASSFNSIGIKSDFCQANAIKYLSRYGRKSGYNRKDLLKALHYVILLLNNDKDKK